MKILGICGSPRKGNSDWMVETLLKAAKGFQKEIIRLRDLNIGYCDGCGTCFGTGKECHIKDEMQSISKKLQEADVVVLGTPNYFKNVSALMKNFMDRTNPLVLPPRLKGKKAIGLCVGGQSLANTEHCASVLREFFRDHRMRIMGIVKARAELSGEIRKRKMEERLAGIAAKLP